MAKCKHKQARQVLRGDTDYTVIAYQCVACLACGVRPLGPSRTASSSYVQEEIEAAQIADNPMLAAREDGYFSGYRAGWLAHQGDCNPGDVGIAWRAEWFASELTQVDQTTAKHFNHDPHAWSWDISRPVVGQYMESLRADPLYAKVMEANANGPEMPADIAPWSCPVASQECAIRRECTNKCGRKDPALADLDTKGPAWKALNDAFDAEDGDEMAIDSFVDQSAEACIARDPKLQAIEYELTRAAEPDCRDEDGPEVERIMAEMEVDRG